jgi:hypothetical protein
VTPKSKKRLFADLADLAQDPMLSLFADAGLKHPKVGNETYGRMSCIYLYTENVATRLHLERALSALGHRINSDYHPGSGTAEVVVSYFKGEHWDQ